MTKARIMGPPGPAGAAGASGAAGVGTDPRGVPMIAIPQPAIFGSVGEAAPATDRLYITPFVSGRAFTIATAVYFITTVDAAAGAGTVQVAIYSIAGARLAQSAVVNGGFTVAGRKAVALAYALVANTRYLFGLAVAAPGSASLRAENLTSTVANARTGASSLSDSLALFQAIGSTPDPLGVVNTSSFGPQCFLVE